MPSPSTAAAVARRQRAPLATSGQDLGLVARSRTLLEGSRRSLGARAHARVLHLALMSRSLQLVERSRRTLGVMVQGAFPPADAANAPGASAEERASRCTQLGCGGEAQYRVRFVATFDTHETVLSKFTLRVCAAHRTSLARLVGDGRVLEKWRRRVEARGGSALSLLAVRAVFAPLN